MLNFVCYHLGRAMMKTGKHLINGRAAVMCVIGPRGSQAVKRSVLKKLARRRG